MTHSIRHLFWDFDGTLYDSYPQLLTAFEITLAELELPGLFSSQELLAMLKVSVYHTCCQCAAKTGLDADLFMRTFRVYHERKQTFTPYDGLESCLRTLHAAGFRHYLYTHRNLAAVEQLQLDGLWPLFADAVTRADGFADKPAPDALLAMMARNDLTADECAMVGDRDIDIMAGRNAGMAGILFDPDGFYDSLTVEMRVHTMRELADLLLK